MKIALVALFIITFAYSQYLGVQLSKAENLLSGVVRITYTDQKDLPEPGTKVYEHESYQGFVRGHNNALENIRRYIRQNSDHHHAQFLKRQPNSTATENRQPVGE
jgi:hypothetical protein